MGKPWRRKDKIVSDAPFDYKWSSQSYSLKGILSSFKLPVVVQCREDTDALHVQNFFFDLRQPIVLHSRRTIRKVFARCIRKGDGGTVKELLPEVVIPEDYAGWFKISKGLNFAKPVPHKTIDSLSRSNSEFFLCTTEFNAIVITSTDHDSDDSTVVRPVLEGEVLRKTGVERLNHQIPYECQSAQASFDNRYLMCIDDKDCELYIPIMQNGMFYEVSDGQFNKNDNSVVQISDILDELVELPIYVRHILGDPPPISKFYSPCLKLCRAAEEESVMGSTLDAGEDILPLELQTHSPVRFEIALNTPMLNSCYEYLEAVEMCNSVGHNYITDMKLAVTFTLKPENDKNSVNGKSESHINEAFMADENEEPDSLSNSQRTSVISGSELGEVDAKSEFSIQWDPSLNPDDTRAVNSHSLTNSNCTIDSLSIDSFDIENMQQLNSEISSIRPAANLEQSFAMWQNHFNKSFSEAPRKNTNNQFLVDPTSDIEVTPFADIVEGVTDFSVKPQYSENRADILTPPSPFQNKTGVKVNPLAQTSPTILSSNSTIASCGSDIDLSDYFPSIHSSSCESLKSRETPVKRIDSVNNDRYSSTDDVFNASQESMETKPKNNGAIAKHWGDMYKVVRRKDKKGRTKMSPVAIVKPNTSELRSKSMSDDLIHFDDSLSDIDNMHTNGIITSKASDEMMSSYNDLRLSLEEVTKNARDNHTEISWRDFCLERSCSLPVRTKNTNVKVLNETDDHAQSWEQISPRQSNTNSTSTTSRHSGKKLSKKRPNLNESYDLNNGDKTQLILDTSSEEGGTSSHRSEDIGNTSFTLSEASDMSVTDGQLEFLEVMNEMDNYLDEIYEIDGTVREANTLTRDKTKLAQKMKIKREIKRKKLAEWNDVVEVI